jgi:hypothetical protein
LCPASFSFSKTAPVGTNAREKQLDTTTVAQAGSLLYRGLAIRRRADCQSAKRQIANLRHTRRAVRVGGGVKLHRTPVGPKILLATGGEPVIMPQSVK